MKKNNVSKRTCFILLCCTVFIGIQVSLLAQKTRKVTWGIDDEELLVYKGGGRTIDPFGYELKGRHPSPHLVYNLKRVPFYFSMILPNRPIPAKGSKGEDNRYRFIIQTDRINPYVRALGKVFGEHRPSKTVDGKKVLHLHHKMKFKGRKDKGYEKDPFHFTGGTMTVDIYYDPELRAIRKVDYEADLKFAGGPKENQGRTKSITRSETFRLVSHRKIGTNDFQSRIQKAIDRGVDYLVDQIGDDKKWNSINMGDYEGSAFDEGPHTLYLLTLLEMDDEDVTRDSELIKNGMEYLYGKTNFTMPADDKSATKTANRKKALPMKFKKTYTTALAMMAMEAYYESSSEKLASRLLMQGKNPPKNITRKRMRPEDRIWMKQALNWLIKNGMISGGGWDYPGSGRADNSNSQYGALGLYAALQSRVQAPHAELKKAVKYWKKNRQAKEEEEPDVSIPLSPLGSGTGVVKTVTGKSRGWGYTAAKSQKHYGHMRTVRMAMTAGGVGSLEILKNYLQTLNRLDPKTRKKLRKTQLDGLAWMTKNWTLRPYPNFPAFDPPGWNTYQYYAMYALERAGMLLKLGRLCGHRWYPEGAELILRRQRNGHWGGPVATCFALLFLKRATNPIMTK